MSLELIELKEFVSNRVSTLLEKSVKDLYSFYLYYDFRKEIAEDNILIAKHPMSNLLTDYVQGGLRKNITNEDTIAIYKHKPTGIVYATAEIKINSYMSDSVGYVDKKDFQRLMHKVKNKIKNKKIEPPILDEELLKTVAHEVNTLKNNTFEKQYGIKMNRGIIFYGPPGNGKTLLTAYIRALALQKNLSVCTYKTYDLEKAYNEKNLDGIFKNAKIQIFDDVDINMFDKSRRHPMCSSLLSSMDGINKNTNHLRIFTTNEEVISIDVAFRRPGRIDSCIKVDKPTAELRNKFWNSWKQKPPEIEIIQLCDLTKDFSFAQMDFVKISLVNRFLQYGEWNIEKAVDYVIQANNIQRPKKFGF